MENFKKKIKNQKRRILIRLLPPILAFLIRFLARLVRFEFHIAQDALERFNKEEPFVIAFWHGELLLQSRVFQKYAHNKRIWVLISRHFDGEIISATVRHFGIRSLRGSSSKGGIGALLNAVTKIKDKECVVITPDGPRGPYHSIADGIIFLAQKANVPIVVSRIFCENAWELKSWDRFRIPKPLSKVCCVVGGPFCVNGMDLESAKAFLKDKMEQDKCALLH